LQTHVSNLFVTRITRRYFRSDVKSNAIAIPSFSVFSSITTHISWSVSSIHIHRQNYLILSQFYITHILNPTCWYSPTVISFLPFCTHYAFQISVGHGAGDESVLLAKVSATHAHRNCSTTDMTSVLNCPVLMFLCVGGISQEAVHSVDNDSRVVPKTYRQKGLTYCEDL